MWLHSLISPNYRSFRMSHSLELGCRTRNYRSRSESGGLKLFGPCPFMISDIACHHLKGSYLRLRSGFGLRNHENLSAGDVPAVIFSLSAMQAHGSLFWMAHYVGPGASSPFYSPLAWIESLRESYVLHTER
jgi:hypothetical protein